MNWLKVAKGIHYHPKVLRFAKLEQITVFEAVGVLVAVWDWFDTHSPGGEPVDVSECLSEAIRWGDDEDVHATSARCPDAALVASARCPDATLVASASRPADVFGREKNVKKRETLVSSLLAVGLIDGVSIGEDGEGKRVYLKPHDWLEIYGARESKRSRDAARKRDTRSVHHASARCPDAALVASARCPDATLVASASRPGVEQNRTEEKRTEENVRENVLPFSNENERTDMSKTTKTKKTILSIRGQELFDRWYSGAGVEDYDGYPRKEARADAEKAFAAARPTEQEISDVWIPAVRNQLESPSWLKDGGEYIPLPASWIRGGRMLDEPMKRPAPAASPPPVEPPPVIPPDCKMPEFRSRDLGDERRYARYLMADGELFDPECYEDGPKWVAWHKANPEEFAAAVRLVNQECERNLSRGWPKYRVAPRPDGRKLSKMNGATPVRVGEQRP